MNPYINFDPDIESSMDPGSDRLPHIQQPHNHQQLHRQQQQQQRRPRGFAATAVAAAAAAAVDPCSPTTSGGGKGKREREKEKERTKLRERHRRAITSRMLAGLRQYGNFPLHARADMNDVLAALAREAGWTVDADGTTYRQSTSTPPPQLAAFPGRSVDSPISPGASLKSGSMKAAVGSDCQRQPGVMRIDGSLSPVSFDSVVVADRHPRTGKYDSSSPINSAVDCLDPDQLIQDVNSGERESVLTETPYVPVYVKLTNGIINNYCQLIDRDGIVQELSHIKSVNADGVLVDCWWGIIEAWSPQKYVWTGYRELFNLIHEFKLKLQVVLAFHECGGHDSVGMPISLPQWVLEIGKENQDIYFTDREGMRNTECLSWGIDKERVLRGRTGIEVYFDLMRSFRTEFDDLFNDGLISAIEIGMGASGELKYPSSPEQLGWRYPGIGEFQCYDKYLQQSLTKAAKQRGHSFWGRAPDNAGQYNSRPDETGFFCERGDYDSYYGRFFLRWYAQTLVDHADNVLSLATLAFEETKIIVKVPSVHWWYKTASHAAELTAGYYNPTNQDGYSPAFKVLNKHAATVKFVFSGLVDAHGQENHERFADPEGLNWQVLNSAWEQGLRVGGANACYDQEGYMQIVEMAKPRNDPDSHHFDFFVYQSPPDQRSLLSALDLVIKCMHGDLPDDLLPC